ILQAPRNTEKSRGQLALRILGQFLIDLHLILARDLLKMWLIMLLLLLGRHHPTRRFPKIFAPHGMALRVNEDALRVRAPRGPQGQAVLIEHGKLDERPPEADP